MSPDSAEVRGARPEGVAVLDVHGRLVHADERFCDLVGVGQTSVVGRPLEAVLGTVEGVDGHGLLVRLAGESVVRWSATLRPDTTTPIPTLVRATLIPSATTHRALGALLVVTPAERDREPATDDGAPPPAPLVPDGVALGEEGERRNRDARFHRLEELGRLAGGVAHDFNNLLTVVQAYLQIIGDAVKRGERVQESDLTEIRHAVERGRELTGHLLAFARNRPVTRQLVDVNVALRSLSGMLRPLLGTSVALGYYLAPSVPLIMADPVQLDQVLLNLAINACDAMTEGGHLSIATRHVRVEPGDLPTEEDGPSAGDYVVIEVSDTGHGMSAATQSRIFEPFFTTRTVAGTGLGLAVVSGIVRQSGGSIAVRSTLGRGTTFRIYWPSVSPIDETAVELPSGGLGICVMVIHEDVALRQMIRLVLADAGFDTAQARDVNEAMAMLTSRWVPGTGPAIVLAEVPDGTTSGVELSDQLARHRPDLPMVLISTCASRPLLPERLPNVPVPAVTGPFDRGRIVRALHEALSQWDG